MAVGDPIEMMGTKTYAVGVLLAIILMGVLPTLEMIRHRMVRARVALRKAVHLPADVTIVKSEEAVECAAEAYDGTDQQPGDKWMHWILGSTLDSKGEKRRGIIQYILRFFLTLEQNVPGTVIFGVRGSDGVLSAVISVTPYLDGLPEERTQTGGPLLRGPIIGGLTKWLRFIGAMASIYPRHGSGAFGDKATSARFRAARKLQGAAHRQACEHSRPHLYVSALAVKPSRQGRGHAAKLLKHVNELADKLGCACYLQCSTEKAKQIAAHHGYRAVGGKPLSPPLEASTGADDQGKSAAVSLWSMERPIVWPRTQDEYHGGPHERWSAIRW